MAKQRVDRGLALGDQRLDARVRGEVDVAGLGPLPLRYLVELADDRGDAARVRAACGARARRPPFLIGEERRQGAEEVEVRLELAVSVLLPLEPSRLGLGLDPGRDHGEGARAGQREPVVPAHVGAHGAVEEGPGPVDGHEQVRVASVDAPVAVPEVHHDRRSRDRGRACPRPRGWP
jgi:hypothetical protein